MRLLKFRGGVHPDSRKTATTHKAIETLPIPKVLYVPVQQHIGAPANPQVEIGQEVLKGQLLAPSQGTVSAPIHAPTSGVVRDICEYTAPHPSGLPVKTLVIESDGEDRWVNTIAPIDPLKLSSEEIAARVGAQGVVGMGGATFPSAIKLNLGKKHPINTLIINGAECEPYLTCDDRLMQEQAESITEGILIIQHALNAGKIIIAIEDNKAEAIRSMQMAASAYPQIEVRKIPTRYPMGSEKHLVQAVTGKEVPARKLSADIGLVVHNVATAYAVNQAVRYGLALVSRVVTVSGMAIKTPKNLLVPLGTPVEDLIEYCDGFKQSPARILMGGPMMGQPLPHTRVPVIKGSGGIIALSEKEVAEQTTRPCIRCGSCVSACPCGLMPLELASRAKSGDFEGALNYGLMDCVACGSCAYVCPSHIPLVQYFNFAKGSIATKQRDQQRTQETRSLAEKRTARLERDKREKAEAAARRKAEKLAKQKREAETQKDEVGL